MLLQSEPSSRVAIRDTDGVASNGTHHQQQGTAPLITG